MDLKQSIKQEGRLIMNASMEQAFNVLTLPLLELTDWLEREIDQNPLLQVTDRPPSEFNPALIEKKPTLYEYLLGEIPLHFETKEDREKATFIAGSLDENGFLTLSQEELKGFEDILKVFHQIEPLGLGAKNVQESLLIQLKGKEGSPSYSIIKDHYQDLLHQRWVPITKKLKLTIEEIKALIVKHVRPLTPFPGRLFEREVNPFLTADVIIQKEEDLWTVEINDTYLPKIQLLDSLKTETSPYLTEGKWVLHILDHRRKTLEKIALYLLKKQRDYFEGIREVPLPMTMSSVAKALEMSESTITRAISHKAIASPRGLLKLRDFFKANHDVKHLLLKLIEQEKEPLSDEALSQELSNQGIICARRTITKYRKELKIGSAAHRKRSL